MYTVYGVSISVVLTHVWSVFAQNGPNPNTLAPWIEGGTSIALVTAFIYVAKKVFAGDLVSKYVAIEQEENKRRNDKYAELVLENKRLIEKTIELVQESQSREDALRALLLDLRRMTKNG